MSTFLHEPGTFFSWWTRRHWREQDTHATTLEQDLGICWLRSLAQKTRSSAPDALAVFRLFLASRKRKSCLHHRNDCVVPELKPENPTPLLDTNSAFTEANVRCKDATVIRGRRKRIAPFHLDVIQSTGSYLSELNVWRIYLLVDDEITLKWLCSYLKHPNVWEIQSGAHSRYFIFIFSFRGKIAGWVG